MFLIDEYLTLHSQQNLTRSEINRIKENLNKYIKYKKKQLIDFLEEIKRLKMILTMLLRA